jgi:hypothetical protein
MMEPGRAVSIDNRREATVQPDRPGRHSRTRDHRKSGRVAATPARARSIDWVGLFVLTDGDANPRAWMYLNGTPTRPALGLSGATLQATAPFLSRTL